MARKKARNAPVRKKARNAPVRKKARNAQAHNNELNNRTARPMAHPQNDYETMVAGLVDWIWGKGKPDILRQLMQADPDHLAETIGHVTYALVQQGAEQASAANKDFDMEMLMGVATEVIESLEKMAAAMNLQFDGSAVALQALMTSLTDYAQSQPDSSQSRQEALEELKQLTQEDMEGAAQTVNEIGQRNGMDPFAQAKQPSSGQGDMATPPDQENGNPLKNNGLMGYGSTLTRGT